MYEISIGRERNLESAIIKGTTDKVSVETPSILDPHDDIKLRVTYIRGVITVFKYEDKTFN